MCPSDRDSQQFYDALAGTYDTMIPIEKRLGAARKLAQRLLEQAPAESAIDCATGTGLFAIALAQAGVTTTGVDLSAEMIAQAKKRGEAVGVKVRWLAAPMEELGEHLEEPADLILCLGNSLPHLLDDDTVAAAIAGWRRLLKPGGRLLIQLLNYERVLADRERIVAVTRAGDSQFVRFYDFDDPLIRFNVLRIDWDGDRETHRLESVPLRPYTWADLQSALQNQDFASVEAFGDLAFEPFAPAASQALVIRAVAP